MLFVVILIACPVLVFDCLKAAVSVRLLPQVPQLYGTGGFEAQAQIPTAWPIWPLIGKYLLNEDAQPAVASR
jgi:hypothetical protein